MDERQLRYFASVYETGSLAASAQTLRIATSAISHHISNLETEIGMKLFERKPRGMEPTAAGHRLNIHAVKILESFSSALEDMRATCGEIAGKVAVGMAYSAVKSIGVDFATRVLSDFPKVELAISESLSGSTLVHLMESEVEIALLYNPPPDPRLRTLAVLEERMVLVGKPEIIGKSTDPVSFDDILELPLILLRQGISARALMDDVTLLKKLESRAKLQINSIQAIAGSLEAGLGCLIGTRLFLQEQLAEGSLHARPIIEPELSRTLYICELASRPPTFALEAIRQLLLELVEQAVETGRWEARLL